MRMKKNPVYRLEVMQKRLENLLHLLDLWQQYIDIIYAPEVEIDLKRVFNDQDKNP